MPSSELLALDVYRIGASDHCRPQTQASPNATVPTQQCVGLDHEDRSAVTAERTGERGEDRAVVGFEPRTRVLALQDGELVAEHEDLDVFGVVRATAQPEQVEYQADKTVETGHAPIFAAPEPRRSRQRETAGHYTGWVFRHPHATMPDDNIKVIVGVDTHTDTAHRGRDRRAGSTTRRHVVTASTGPGTAKPTTRSGS
jgi:hypothetical protein